MMTGFSALRSSNIMASRVYILGGFQSDFSQNWAREGVELMDAMRHVVLSGLGSRMGAGPGIPENVGSLGTPETREKFSRFVGPASERAQQSA